MFLLRWRFDFSDTKPSRFGDWGIAHSHDPSKMAAYVNKENLTRACVEALNPWTQEILPLVQCDGHEFVNFKWMAEVRANDCGIKHTLVGMMLVTRLQQISVLNTGEILVDERTDEDKLYHYEGFGR